MIRRFVAASAAALGIALVWVVLGMGPPDPRLPALVSGNVGASGVEHPVTAVLLAFRAYDTLLEVAVLLVAVLPVLAASATNPHLGDLPVSPREPVLFPFTRLLVPFAVIVSGHLLWAGSHAPGGAFQAGAVLAAAAVVLRLAGRLPTVGLELRWMRAALLVGLATFVGVAVGTAAAGAGMLALPPEFAGALILAIEFALTVSIGVTLCGMFPGTVAAEATVGTGASGGTGGAPGVPQAQRAHPTGDVERGAAG